MGDLCATMLPAVTAVPAARVEGVPQGASLAPAQEAREAASVVPAVAGAEGAGPAP